MTNGSSGWDNFFKEGFNTLKDFQGETNSAVFEQGENGIQLKLGWRVDAIYDPLDGELGQAYSKWYSIGDPNGKTWQIINEGQALAPIVPEPGFVKTTKMAKLMQAMVALNAPMIHSGIPPWEARAWMGINGRWQDQELKYPGLQDTSITVPVQLFQAQPVGYVQQQQPQAAPVQQAAPQQAAPQQAPPMSAPPSMAPPPMSAPPAAAVATFVDTHWGENREVWRNYIQQLCRGMSKDAAATAIWNNEHLRGDSILVQAVNDGSFWAYAESSNLLKDTAGVLM